jgi:ubiquinone/menaquinone biosynthesis C-methylase UbiE
VRTAIAGACAAAIGLTGCNGFSKLDLSKLGRATWQRPTDVVESLDLAPGDRVADLGAGKGYFIPYLTRAVPDGRVYAVEIDPERIEDLEERFGHDEGVQVVSGQPDDPGLPDASVDVVLIVNTYHHIEDREAYFRGLRRDLRPGGRVAIVDGDPELGGILGLFLPKGHTMPREQVKEEMGSAGYRHAESHDFLPLQVFEVYVAP